MIVSIRILAVFCFGLMLSLSGWAESDLLPAQQAFKFSITPKAEQQVTLNWEIAPNYYLYQQKIQVYKQQHTVALDYPKAETIVDENFGESQIYWHRLQLNVGLQPNQQYRVVWQGCAKDRVCYAPQSYKFSTDAHGQIVHSPLSKLNRASTSSVFMAQSASDIEKSQNQQEKDVVESVVATAIKPVKQELKETSVEPSSSDVEPVTGLKTQKNAPVDDVERVEQGSSTMETSALPSAQVASEMSISDSMSEQPLAQDMQWLNTLQDRHFMYAVVVFLGLGILLAFTPCSLPMLPILSSLVIRQKTGVRAWLIALSFVLSMATVYAFMGMLASSIGFGLQRWLQQPAVLIAFSVLFIVFALNLFGVFEMTLPNGLTQRLNQWSAKQQGGTVWGAVVMGILSALLIGPCMTAPLAGVLLFIAQTESVWQGGTLLFCLGLGMGIPLLVVSVLGAKVLPKAGEWLIQVKVIFAFIMLALSIYFVRSLLNEWVLLGLILLWWFSVVGYVAYWAIQRLERWVTKIAAILALLVVWVLGGYAVIQPLASQTQSTVQAHQTWIKVRDKTELDRTLAQYQGQKIVIDVYADWCVACRSVEAVLRDMDVQEKLQSYTLIKLDLSQYDEHHQALLDEWQILAPPTLLFLDETGQEQRHIRLVGTFKKEALLQRLQ